MPLRPVRVSGSLSEALALTNANPIGARFMALDQADKDAIAAMIAGAVKPEVLGAAVKAHIDGLKLGETIAAEVAKLAPPKVDPPKVDPPKGDKGSDEGAQRLAALEKQLSDEKAARTAAEDARRADARDSAVRDALAKAGVPADRIRHAMATLGADGLLTFTADGKPGWKGKDQFGVDTVLSPEDAALKWVGTTDGKLFLPPTGAGGTGEGSRNVGGLGTAGAPATLDGLRGNPALGATIFNALQQ